ncbi:hypothetical protein AXF42_Ash018905 [Apostasia shenzhenica]|uniref:Uncharacterized protein n=1 Tax=Apostasia shenzhenica TaxID=1088818 RepID=A0A2I0B535_9ASPA|nr:hypothetical protein AXF42_Ash018905 [Apostasia shenzhenica]
MRNKFGSQILGHRAEAPPRRRPPPLPRPPLPWSRRAHQRRLQPVLLSPGRRRSFLLLLLLRSRAHLSGIRRRRLRLWFSRQNWDERR